jgi:hypothetical protein
VKLARVDEDGFKPARLEQFVDRNPVDVRALHLHRFHTLLDKPVRQLVQLGSRRSKDPNVRVSARRRRRSRPAARHAPGKAPSTTAPPYEATHTVRYFGVLAPSAGVRAKVIREPALRRRRGCEAVQERSDTGLAEEAVRAALRDEIGFDPLALGPPPMPERARRLEWASLLERVFDGGHSAARLLRGQPQGARVHPQRPDGPRDPRETGGRRHRSFRRKRLALGRIRSTSTCIREDTGVDPKYPD